MPISPWDIKHNRLGCTPREYVQKSKLGHAETAADLNSIGFATTTDAVRGIRRRSKSTPRQNSISQTQNELVAETNDRRIKTLSQLIQACDINLDIWDIANHIINKWEVGTFIDGVPVVEPLWQVKAWLVRKVPVAIAPVVQPVQISSKSGHRSVIKRDGVQKALILPDPQFGFRKDLRTGNLDPFHDRSALDVALQIAYDYEFNKVVWLGDVLDLADWSDKFIRSPEFYFTTQAAVVEAAWWLREFRSVTEHSETFVLEGNHEKRASTAINTHMMQAYNLKPADELHLPPAMSVQRLLALDSMNIKHVGNYPAGEVWINGQVKCIHGDVARSASGATVSGQIDDIQETVIQGHVHRVESAFKTLHTYSGQKIVSMWSMGCLCRLDGVVPGVNPKQNWQQAIGIVEYTEDSHAITAVPIQNGKAIYRGEQYVARDRVADLVRDTKWEF